MIRDQLEEEALELRANRLMAKAFAALKRARKYDEGRSKKYAVFSAWKFYVKEKILLKRYLIECGETSIGMSTLQMHETVKNHELKKSFGSNGGRSQECISEIMRESCLDKSDFGLKSVLAAADDDFNDSSPYQ
jgi:hypothetical protein